VAKKADSNPTLDLGVFIREQRRIAELSVRRLAELAGVSNPYLSQIERGLRKPSAEILQQIAKALEISSETLYVRAGILDEDRAGHHSDVEETIRRAPELSAEQKKALLGVYRSFVTGNPDVPDASSLVDG
jgi:transcriptional regulator with XRE-family HTH domain